MLFFSCSCDQTEFGMEYLPVLHDRLTRPLITKVSQCLLAPPRCPVIIIIAAGTLLLLLQASDGVSEVVSLLEVYDMTRDDWDSVLELAHYSGRTQIMSMIDTKVCG